MKLFIWEGGGVLTGYTDGIIVALGKDLEDALKAIKRTQSYAVGNFPSKPTKIIDLDNRKASAAWLCWGGG